jgi:hypothetical protein
LIPALNTTAKKIECEDSAIERLFLPLVRGRLFHLTTDESFADICRCGWISSGRQAPIALTPGQLERSYGRKRGWVSLYDLSDPTDVEVKEALIRYWLLKTLRDEGQLMCLMIAETVRPSLVSWQRAIRELGEKEFFIPFVEAWYPGDLPLRLVTESFQLIRRPAGR